MPTIIIMNNATEQMLGRRLSLKQSLFAAKAALRNVWLARPGDIVISTEHISSDFIAYVVKVGGLSLLRKGESFIEFLVPDIESTESLVLNDSYLAQPQLIAALRSRITRPEEWTLLACYQTAGTARLQAELGLNNASDDATGRHFAAFLGTDLLNRKSHFRQLATGARMPLASGEVITSSRDLHRAISDLIRITGKVIVKQDNGAGSTGNFVLSTIATGPLPGSSRCLTLPEVDGPERLAVIDELWSNCQDSSPGPLVVEAYYQATSIFYLEFFIHSHGNEVFLNSGSIRLRPHDHPDEPDLFWVGLELPAMIPSDVLAEATLCCGRFLNLAASMGYRGHINIDGIVTTNGDIIFNEANARWGGGTVLHELATRLIGENFTRTHIAASFRDVPSPGFARLLSIIEDNDLSYNAVKQEGILILACDDQHSHSFEALVLARSQARARALENELVVTLARCAGDER